MLQWPTRPRTSSSAAALALALSLVPTAASAQVVPIRTNCPPGQVPRFVFGFAELQARLGPAIMGFPLTCEFADPNGTGDVLQLPTQGLAFWRKRTNTPTFTDGATHWALTAADRHGCARVAVVRAVGCRVSARVPRIGLDSSSCAIALGICCQRNCGLAWRA